MADKIKFLTGLLKDLQNKPKVKGQVYFAIDGNKGKIAFDVDANTRVYMTENPDNALHADKADEATVAIKDSVGNVISSYIKTIQLASDTTKFNYTLGDGSKSGDIRLNFVSRAGDTMTGQLTAQGGILVNTATGTKPLVVSRNGSATNECTTFGQNDGGLEIVNINDEASTSITFKMVATDTESGGGAGANEGKVTFQLSKGETTVVATKFQGLVSNATADALGQNIATNYLKYPLTINEEKITMTRGDGTTSTLTVPDQKVTQSVTNAANFRPVVLGLTHTATIEDLAATVRGQVYVSTKFYASPTKGILVAPIFQGNLTGKADNAGVADYAKNAEGDSTKIRDTYISSVTKDGVKIVVKKGNGNSSNFQLDFLPLAGGTMTGGAFISWPDSGNWSNNPTGLTYPIIRGGLKWTGQSDSVQIYAAETARDNLDLVMKFGDDQSPGISVQDNTGAEKVRIGSNGTVTATKFIGDLTGLVSNATADSLGNIIHTTYIATLEVVTSSSTAFSFRGKSGNGTVRPAEIAIPAASASKAGLVTAGAQTWTGDKTLDTKGSLTIQQTSGFTYTGIETGSSAGARGVWFAHVSKPGTPVYNTKFTYDPASTAKWVDFDTTTPSAYGSLSADRFTGLAQRAAKDSEGNVLAKKYIYTITLNNHASQPYYRLFNALGDKLTDVNLPVASTSYAGVVTTGAQTIAGAKTFTSSISISHATNATMTYETTNPRIIFSESGSQPVGLVYTDYDTYRSPAGLKVLNLTSNNGLAWFEVEGDIYGGRDIKATGNISAGGRFLDKAGQELLASLFVNSFYNATVEANKGTSYVIGGKNSAGTAITSLTLPNASETTAGLITTGAQTLKGDKTLKGNLYATGNFHRFTSGYAIYRTSIAAATNAPSGWYRIAKISAFEGYANFTLYMTASWNSGAPTVAQVDIQIRHDVVYMKQMSGGVGSVFTKLRVVGDPTNGYYLEAYQAFAYSSTTGMAAQYFYLVGNINATTYSPTTANGSGTAVAEISLRIMENTYVDSGSANRMAYYSASNIISRTDHYVSTTQVSLNDPSGGSKGSFTLYVNGKAKVGDATASSSASTGAFQVAGGMGVAKDSWFGKSIILGGIGNGVGLKIGVTTITAANNTNGEIVFQGGHLRFGEKDWDYNQWAGLKYVHSSKTIYLGLADNSIFVANSAQSGGTLALPGVRYLSINGKIAIDANDSWLRINEGKAFSSGIYFGTNIVRTDNVFQVGSSGANFYANSSGHGYFSSTLGIAGTDTSYKLYVNGKSYFTGLMLLQGSQYDDGYDKGALHLNNSNIIGVNGIYFCDAVDSGGEGINFYRDATHTDSFYSVSGKLKYAPNREIGKGLGTTYIVPYTSSTNGTVGSNTHPIYSNAGVLTQCSYYLQANIKSYSGSLAKAGWSTLNGMANSPSIAIAYNNGAAAWNSETYSATMVWGCSDTRGLLDCAYSKPKVTFGGSSFGSATEDAPRWYMSIYGTTTKSYNLDEMPLSTSARYLLDKGNGTATYVHYSSAGMTTTSWFAVWDGYTIRAMSPSYTRQTIQAMYAVSANGYIGMGRPDGNTSDWIRTTSNGLIPYSSGSTSALGTSSWRFATGYIDNFYTKYIALSGNLVAQGAGNSIHTINGTYTATASSRFSQCAIEIRENGLVGSAQSDIGYAPSIGFHWGNRVAATFLFHSDGNFYLRKQNGVDRASLDANLIGNAATASIAKDAGNATFRTTDGAANYILVKINSAQTHWMTAFTLRVYQGYNHYDVTFSGYQYGTNYWYQPQATLTSSTITNVAVHFGYNSQTEMWVAIPGSSYTGAKIINVVNGYQPFSDIANAFSITRVSSLPGTLQKSVTIYRQWIRGEAVTSAVWNDYAECRQSRITEPGYVLYEVGDDSLEKTYRRLQPFAGVSSDTWGFSQGETEKAKTPIAVAGRVLVYTYQDRNNYKPGDCVCAAPGGTVDIMTREEVIEYPDRIVGTVSCVPEYETWGGGKDADREPVKVNGRIWIKVR